MLQGELMFGRRTDGGKPIFWLQGQSKSYALLGADSEPVTNAMDAEARAIKLINGGGATQLRQTSETPGSNVRTPDVPTEVKAPDSSKLRISLEDPDLNSQGGSGVWTGGFSGLDRGERGSALSSGDAVQAFNSQGVLVKVFNSNPDGHVKNARMEAIVVLDNSARGGTQYAQATANPNPGLLQFNASNYSLPKKASAEFKRGYRDRMWEISQGQTGEAAKQSAEGVITGRATGKQGVSVPKRPITTEWVQKRQPTTPTTPAQTSTPPPSRRATNERAYDNVHKALLDNADLRRAMEHATSAGEVKKTTDAIEAMEKRDVFRGATGADQDGTFPRDESAPAPVTNRGTLEDRILRNSRRLQEERFDGTGMTYTVTRVAGRGSSKFKATGDEPILNGYPTKVRDICDLIGGLNNSQVFITAYGRADIDVRVLSPGFKSLLLNVGLSKKGISTIKVEDIAIGNRIAITPDGDSVNARHPMVGTLLGLKIVKYADEHGIKAVEGTAGAHQAGNDFQGYRVWTLSGFDGPVGTEGASLIRNFLYAIPAVSERVGLRADSVRATTKVLDFLCDSTGTLVPESVKFWRSVKVNVQGKLDLNPSSSVLFDS